MYNHSRPEWCCKEHIPLKCRISALPEVWIYCRRKKPNRRLFPSCDPLLLFESCFENWFLQIWSAPRQPEIPREREWRFECRINASRWLLTATNQCKTRCRKESRLAWFWYFAGWWTGLPGPFRVRYWSEWEEEFHAATLFRTQSTEEFHAVFVYVLFAHAFTKVSHAHSELRTRLLYWI